MDWDQDACIKLISEYRDQPVLWNSLHSAYYNKVKKENAWRELAEKFGKRSEDVKKKIDSLKGSYRREKSRVKKSIGKWKRYNDSEIYESKWFAYKNLQFLDGKDESGKDIFTWPDDDKLKESSDDNFCEERDLKWAQVKEPVSSSPVIVEQVSAHKTRKKQFKCRKRRHQRNQRISDDEDQRTVGEFEYLEQPTESVANQQKDQCDLFADYIADKLRSFDNHLRAVAQNRISNLIFELEMGVYQHSETCILMQSPLPGHCNFCRRTQTLHSQSDDGIPDLEFKDELTCSPTSEHLSVTPPHSSQDNQ